MEGPEPAVWWAAAPVTALVDLRPAAYASLSARERARIAALDDRRADEVLLGRWLLRSLVAAHVPDVVPGAAPIAPGDVVLDAACPTCGREHGRPRLPGLPLLGSIAHAGGLVVAAVAGAGPAGPWRAIGVDTEPEGSQGLAPAELLAWTRTEAIAKATGVGIAGGTSPDAGGADDPGPWRTHRLDTPGFVTTLVVR